MIPAKEWLDQYKKVMEKTASPVDFNTYFQLPEIAGKQLTVLDIGPCSLPSGKILVRDPLCYLDDREEQPYFVAAPAGTYRTEICVVKPDEDGDCARYAAVRLCFSEKPASRFYEALVGHENLEELGDDGYFGFPVDAGLGCICDQVLHGAFCDFSERWQREHPNGNLYDDYFAALFEESYQAHPAFQRRGGDWLNWRIPDTEYRLPIFQSGFGDGVYPVYWGFDKGGALCQLVVQFIDLVAAYAEMDEESED